MRVCARRSGGQQEVEKMVHGKLLLDLSPVHTEAKCANKAGLI